MNRYILCIWITGKIKEQSKIEASQSNRYKLPSPKNKGENTKITAENHQDLQINH